MIPLPENPTVVVLVDDRKLPVAVATNVSPELNLIIANTSKAFEDEARGKPFVTRIECGYADFRDVEQTQGSFNRTV